MTEHGQPIQSVTAAGAIGTLMLLGFAILWNVCLVVIFILSLTGKKSSNPAAAYAVFSLLVLIGAAFLWNAIDVARKVGRYHSLNVRLATPHGVIGGHIAGTLHSDEGVMGDGMSLHLECWRRGYRRGQREKLWESVCAIPGTTAVPFRFDIPPDREPTDARLRRTFWTLSVYSQRRGLVARFDIHVNR